MKIRLGYDIIFTHPQPTPMLLMLNIHYSRASHILIPDHMRTSPAGNLTQYRDSFGNWCSRFIAPPGEIRFSTDALIFDPGTYDVQDPGAIQHEVSALPDECLQFLLGSRYCETDRLMDIAWSLFANAPTGWARVQAICDFVHNHITFGYPYARNTRTAFEAYNERVGVCRDFAHLAVTLCRCMNIPARYCTGYLGDIGVRRKTPRRWISPPGSRSIYPAAGSPSMPVTTRRGSGASRMGGTPPISRSPPISAPARSINSKSLRTRFFNARGASYRADQPRQKRPDIVRNHRRVKKRVVYDIVHMPVHVVIHPARGDRGKPRIDRARRGARTGHA
jgi:hypothetical protein